MAEYVAALARTLQLPPHHLVVMEDAAGVGVEYASRYGGGGGGGGKGVVLRSLSFLEPQLQAPTYACVPAGVMTLPLGLGSAFAASPLLPLAISRGCAPGGTMSSADASAHAFLLRVDGALNTARAHSLYSHAAHAARAHSLFALDSRPD